MNLKCNFTNDNSGNFPGDVIRLVRYLKLTPGYDEIYALAKKEMAPVLLHAAAFDNLISRVALVKPYSSYRSVVMNRFYNYDFVNSFVARSLLAYDLPGERPQGARSAFPQQSRRAGAPRHARRVWLSRAE